MKILYTHDILRRRILFVCLMFNTTALARGVLQLLLRISVKSARIPHAHDLFASIPRARTLWSTYTPFITRIISLRPFQHTFVRSTRTSMTARPFIHQLLPLFVTSSYRRNSPVKRQSGSAQKKPAQPLQARMPSRPSCSLISIQTKIWMVLNSPLISRQCLFQVRLPPAQWGKPNREVPGNVGSPQPSQQPAISRWRTQTPAF